MRCVLLNRWIGRECCMKGGVFHSINFYLCCDYSSAAPSI